MANYSLPHFGEIDASNLEEYYDVDIEFNDSEIQIDLNFEGSSIDTKRMEKVKKFIENLESYDKQNVKYIEEDYKNEENDTVKTYIDHHLEEIDKDELAEIIDFDNKSVKPEIQMMKALRLVRVGFYPDSEDQFAIFDYTIGKDLTNYLVVINTNENGELDYMSMES